MIHSTGIHGAGYQCTNEKSGSTDTSRAVLR